MTAEYHKEKGPLLLLAGPGTGKTYQLALRLKYLVEDQEISPEQITVITFTAAAAANMRTRISNPENQQLFLRAQHQPKPICTMHSLGYSIIRENASILGLPDDLIVVHSDRAKSILLGDAAQLAGFRREEAEATARCRQHGACHHDDSSPECAICSKYRDILGACKAIDYDEQILLACRLLRENPEVAEKCRERTRHLLVDEYQDINAGQFELIKILSEGQEEGLFVVGDDDQSIYSWRGGSPEFIRNFEAHFRNTAHVESLLRSYRCHRNILEGALAVVKEFDKKRRDKGAFDYECPEGPKITIHNVPSDKKEAIIVRKIVEDALPAKEVLILVPHRGFSKLIGEQLRRARIRYISPEPLPGEGLPILERLAAWLHDATDSLALRECIEAIVNSRGSPLPSKRVRKEEKKQEREAGLRLISQLWEAVIKDGNGLWANLQGVGTEEKELNFVKEACSALRNHAESDDVAELLKQATISLEPWKKASALIEEVEGWINRFGTSSDSGSSATVRIMTLQGAKGLEADVVCVVGLEEGTLPRNGSSNEELAEQARLMYVSMTRAKQELHLFHARNRSAAVSFQAIHGTGGAHRLEPSRFIQKIPKEFSERRYHPSR